MDMNRIQANGDVNSPPKTDTSSNAPISSSELSQTDINPQANKKSLSSTVLAVALGITLIAIVVLTPMLFKYFKNRNTSTLLTSATMTDATSTSSTSTTNTLIRITNTVPTIAPSCNATCSITRQSAVSTYTAAWTFEKNLNDIANNNYNGTGVNNPGYATGYIGQALSLTGTEYVTTPFINFANSSFTIEAWIKPTKLVDNGPDYAIFGECESSDAIRANCMQLLLRNSSTYSLYMDFGVDDLNGSTTVSSSVAGTWLHVAFVFDYSLKQQIIYRNGYNDGQTTLSEFSPGAYVGTSGLVNIGAQQTTDLFNGLIDHMFVTNRAKSSCEILDDATLVVYYSFDSGSVQDSGPNYIVGTATSGVRTVTGHLNQALQFGSSNAYFSFGDLVALGVSNRPFSFSMWVKPTANTGSGTILHVSNGADGFNSPGAWPWCIPFIGFNAAGRLTLQIYNGEVLSLVGPSLTLNVWTHIAQTFSTANGVILYVNGIQVATTYSTTYSASGMPNYVFIGYYGLGSGCTTGSIVPGVFYGAVDELRVYSRELTASDVCVLANQ